MKRALAVTGTLIALVSAYPRATRDAIAHVLRPAASTVTSVGGTVDMRDPDVRARLREAAGNTYIGDILTARDSAIARWRDRRLRPVTVWVQPRSAVRDWKPELVKEARYAFAAWNSVDLPIRFAIVDDSTRAEVHVTWIDKFDAPISGRTKWARDDDWWITDGDITIAVHHHSGETLDAEAIRALTLHEVGHLLGLDHTSDVGSIMAPRVRIRSLAEVDRATARLVYTLPAGTVR